MFYVPRQNVIHAVEGGRGNMDGIALGRRAGHYFFFHQQFRQFRHF